ncbi:MAG: extracellular solute-binding protein [Candidatus Paceibacterota bacterium]
MEGESFFKLIVLIILGFAIVIAVLIFAGVLPGFGGSSGGENNTVVMWGVVPPVIMNEVIGQLNNDNRDNFSVTYVAKNSSTIEDELVDALALGQAPDLILAADSMTVSQRNKLYIIPYDSISSRVFSDTFAEITEVYKTSVGLTALPLTIDPVVMYYNRDLYSNTGVASVPKTWTGFLEVLNRLTTKTDQGVITTSGLAFGETNNVTNFKSILELLFLQAGNPLASPTATGFRSVLADRLGFNTAPGPAALDFYTAFSDPSKVTYSWNETLDSDRNMFALGRLANYFGLTSELGQVRAQNPNLNIDAVVVPQREDVGRKTTTGDVLGVSIVRSTANLNTAFTVAWTLATGPYSAVLAQSLAVAPARRDLLNTPDTSNRFEAVFFESALAARTWADPNSIAIRDIFSDMVGEINRRSNNAVGALSNADQKINLLFSNL